MQNMKILKRRKVIGFASTTLYDWLEKLAPLFIQSEVKLKPIVTRTHKFSPALHHADTCNYFEFQMVHWIFFVLWDWLE